jgi:hypothetical protein
MSRSKDPLVLSPHWHVDYRIEAELPEDTVVGRRFLIHAAFTVLALGALGWAAYLGGQTWDLQRQIDEQDRKINAISAEVKQIDALQGEYDREARKVDQAYALVRPRLFVSEFVASIGRTRPTQMAIDLIEWNDATIMLRGGLRDRSVGASTILGQYVETLRRDEKIGNLFETIQLTNVDRGSGTTMLRFELKLVLKERK